MSLGLSIQNLSYIYRTDDKVTTALSNVNFRVDDGEFVAIVGPSGCGKSTLLNIIAGLLPHDAGEITYHNQPLHPDTLSIGYMLQKDYLLNWRTIYQNITLGLEIQKKMKQTECLIPIDHMLKDYGLWEFRNAYPKELSGGMRQRVALIRTLALSPKLLLLDEPFSALDYQTRIKVSDDIGAIIKDQNITTILVTHDLNEAIAMSNRVLVLSKRPGYIKANIKIEYPDATLPPSELRKTDTFSKYYNEIFKEVDSNEG